MEKLNIEKYVCIYIYIHSDDISITTSIYVHIYIYIATRVITFMIVFPLNRTFILIRSSQITIPSSSTRPSPWVAMWFPALLVLPMLIRVRRESSRLQCYPGWRTGKGGSVLAVHPKENFHHGKQTENHRKMVVWWDLMMFNLLVISHNYGKSQFLMRKSTIHGDF